MPNRFFTCISASPSVEQVRMEVYFFIILDLFNVLLHVILIMKILKLTVAVILLDT